MRNQNIFRCGIVIIVVVLAGSFLFASMTRLKEPVFLRYCMEIPEVPMRTESNSWLMELQYITNADDTRRVSTVTFPEAAQLQFYATDTPNGGAITFWSGSQPVINGETIGRYSLRRLYIFLADAQPELLQDGLELHRAQITLDDGSSYLCDIGKIVLSGSDIRDDLFLHSSSSSSSDGSFFSYYSMRGKLKLMELKTPLRQELDAAVQLFLNEEKYTDYLPAEIEQGDKLTIEGRFTSHFGGRYDFDVYDIKPKLVYTRENGSQGYLRIYNITRQRYFTGAWDMFQYLSRVRGVL